MLLLCWESYHWASNLWVLIIYLFFLPVILASVFPRLTTDLAVRVFPGVWKLLSFQDSLPRMELPSRDGAPSLPLLSLFLFYIFSYLFLKTMSCFSECLMSSACIQKLFCGIYSAFQCSFDEFVGEKVVSPSYSSTILGPPPRTFVLKSVLTSSFSSNIYSLKTNIPKLTLRKSYTD